MNYTSRVAWYGAVRRCTISTCSDFPRYGGRGITICNRWLTYENFREDMGEPPPGCTLDRLDTNGPYGPENCRWSTRKEQARNRRSNRIVEAFGKSQTIVEWSEETGLKFHQIASRLHRGWTAEKCLSTPVEFRNPRREYFFEGKQWELRELSKATGIPEKTIYTRVRSGIPVTEAVKVKSIVTHCTHGHEYTDENSYYPYPDTKPRQRQCRTCKRLRDRKRQ